jgi:membrane associated rhomboid family serine protease/Zn-finger nucleic acid-binding protein
MLVSGHHALGDTPGGPPDVIDEGLKYTCPSCGHALERRQQSHGVFWACPNCGGRAVGIGLLKQLRDPAVVTRAWLAAESAPAGHGRPCPTCGGPMRVVTLDTLPRLEICALCEIVWFDPKAYDALPAAAGAIATEAPAADHGLPELGPNAGPVLPARPPENAGTPAGETWRGDPPDAWWKYVAALFGMPVRDGEDQLDRPPWATWGLVAFTCVVSVLAFSDLPRWIGLFGLVPAQAGRDGGLTFLASFFLHAGVWHLAANMYFLLLFGDNVEETIGVGRYLLLIFMAAVIGDVVHIEFDPHRTVPLIGASGGIAGIMAFYACQFPRVRLKFIFGAFWLGLYRWVTVPTWVFFAFWISLQGLGVMAQLSGRSSVSALGHVGGAAVGALFYLGWRFVQAGPPRPETATARATPS